MDLYAQFEKETGITEIDLDIKECDLNDDSGVRIRKYIEWLETQLNMVKPNDVYESMKETRIEHIYVVYFKKGEYIPGYYFRDEIKDLHGPFGTLEEAETCYKAYCIDYLGAENV